MVNYLRFLCSSSRRRLPFGLGWLVTFGHPSIGSRLQPPANVQITQGTLVAHQIGQHRACAAYRSAEYPTNKKCVSLQPVLHQFGRAAVQFVRSAFDVGEHVGDPGQVLEFPAAAVSRRGRVRGVVGTNSRLGGRKDLRDGGPRFRVGVDG